MRGTRIYRGTYLYLSNTGQTIQSKPSTKDLGVTMSSTGEFKEHIANIVDTVRDLTAWILRSFKSRSSHVMLFLWKVIVIPRIDYCSQLWSPAKAYLINQLEELQKQFIRRINGFKDMNYNDTLKKLQLYSLQRRRERYQIIYLWCILEEIYPNIQTDQNSCLIKLQSNIHSRRGRTLVTKNLPNSRFGNLRYNSLPFVGARLFNVLPKSLRNLTSCGKIAFKTELDVFLKTVKDQPLPVSFNHFTQATSNSLATLLRCGEIVLGAHQ